jgi:beta-glucanase (GH16 family)
VKAFAATPASFASFATLLVALAAACSSSGQGGAKATGDAGQGGADAPNTGDESGGSSGGSSSGGSSSGGSSSGYESDATVSDSPDTTDTGAVIDTDAGSMWALAWSDEFNGTNGSAPDPSNWSLQTGNNNGWGNGEFEYYTTDLANAQIQNGNLVIAATTAGASTYQCAYPNNGPCEYTSARMQTKGLFSQLYGRFEASIKIPSGAGLWPAFWGLGNNGGWPTCGEIDIMENRGIEPSINHGSLHGQPGGYQNATGTYTLPGGAALSAAFHLYAVEWEPGVIRFYVDDSLYETQTEAGLAAIGDQWPFTQPFYLLLNVAVGGNFGGAPTAATMFPQTMLVDYVRVYTAVGADY